MKVVFDTNVYISAFALPGGQAGLALTKALEADDEVFISKDIIDEVLTVLARKFNRDAEALSRTALFLASFARTVKPPKKIHLLADEPDNRILECALAARAEALVTGDKVMLALGEFRGVRLLTLRDYLSR